MEKPFDGPLMVKNLSTKAGEVRDSGLIPGSGRAPRRGTWQLSPVLLLGEPHGQRSLVGYSPWGCTESDTTEATQHVGTDRCGSLVLCHCIKQGHQGCPPVLCLLQGPRNECYLLLIPVCMLPLQTCWLPSRRNAL